MKSFKLKDHKNKTIELHVAKDKISIIGDNDEHIKSFQEWFFYQYDRFGHLVEELTSVEDIEYILKTQKIYKLEKPEQVLAVKTVDIPTNAIT